MSTATETVTLDTTERVARVGDTSIDLTREETIVLHLLLNDPSVHTKDSIAARLSSRTRKTTIRRTDTVAASLRRKLTAAGSPRVPHLVWGVGWAWRPAPPA